jgi:hypothetical protein
LLERDEVPFPRANLKPVRPCKPFRCVREQSPIASSAQSQRLEVLPHRESDGCMHEALFGSRSTHESKHGTAEAPALQHAVEFSFLSAPQLIAAITARQCALCTLLKKLLVETGCLGASV